MSPEHAELEGWLRRFDDPQPTPATMEAARRAVRVALDEERLAMPSPPVPSPDVLRRVRETVRRELATRSAGDRRKELWRSPALGGWAAAAAIIAAVAVGWVASVTSTPRESTDAIAALEVALDGSGDEVDEQLVAIEAELAALEAEFSTASAGFGDDAEWMTDELERGGEPAAGAGSDS
jgi:hypothetical protein